MKKSKQFLDRIFHLIDDKQCCICYSSNNLITIDNYYITEKCAHMFHLECIIAYINENGKCPQCRTSQIDEQKGWDLYAEFMDTTHFHEFNIISSYMNIGDNKKKCIKCICCSYLLDNNVVNNNLYSDDIQMDTTNDALGYDNPFYNTLRYDDTHQSLYTSPAPIPSSPVYPRGELANAVVSSSIFGSSPIFPRMLSYSYSIDINDESPQIDTDNITPIRGNTPEPNSDEPLEMLASQVRILKNCDCNCHAIDWESLLSENIVSVSFIDAFKGKIGFDIISKYVILTDTLIDKYIIEINWRLIGANKTFSKRLFLKYNSRLDNITFSRSKFLTEELIRTNINRIHWETLCKFQELSTKFIKDFKDHVCMYTLIKQKKVNKDFVKKNLKFAFDV